MAYRQATDLLAVNTALSEANVNLMYYRRDCIYARLAADIIAKPLEDIRATFAPLSDDEFNTLIEAVRKSGWIERVRAGQTMPVKPSS